MREEVQAALDTVRPQLQADGGDAEIVEITEDGVVKLRLKGLAGMPYESDDAEDGN